VLKIRELLLHPNLDDFLVLEIAQEMRTNKAAFETTAREWTARYAKCEEKQTAPIASSDVGGAAVP